MPGNQLELPAEDDEAIAGYPNRSVRIRPSPSPSLITPPIRGAFGRHPADDYRPRLPGTLHMLQMVRPSYDN